MTKSARYEEAREAIARRLRLRFGNQAPEDAPFSPTAKAFWFADADALLSLSGPDGKPYLAVPSAVQGLPNCRMQRTSSKASPWVTGYERGYKTGYKESQDDMQFAGFMKVEKP